MAEVSGVEDREAAVSGRPPDRWWWFVAVWAVVLGLLAGVVLAGWLGG